VNIRERFGTLRSRLSSYVRIAVQRNLPKVGEIARIW